MILDSKFDAVHGVLWQCWHQNGLCLWNVLLFILAPTDSSGQKKNKQTKTFTSNRKKKTVKFIQASAVQQILLHQTNV